MARILIAEDEVHIVRVLSLWLRRHGHEIIEVGDGKQALEKLAQEPIDLVISDINMPVLDGMGLLKAIREERKLDLPILLLSARCDQMQLGNQVRAYGAQIFPKPFVPSQIVVEIDRLLAAAAT